jgi:Holliday junction resolvase
MDQAQLEREIKRLKDEAEDYEYSVRSLVCFSALVLHDGVAAAPGARFNLGRRMDLVRPAGNQPKFVTPDLVAQRSATYGVVGEIKVKLPRDEAHWVDTVDQLIDYAADLRGWWTVGETVESRDVILLVEISRSRQFSGVVDGLDSDRQESFAPVTLVEFSRSDQGQPYIFFRAERNLPADSDLAGKLRNGVKVPLEKVLQSFPTVKFYDGRPPLLHLLRVLWQQVVASRLDEVEYDENLRAYPIRVSVADAVDELQQAYGSKALYTDGRTQEFPRESWVREALTFLSRHRLAIVDPEETNQFTVLFRRYKDDIVARFASMIIGQAEIAPASGDDQMELFQSDPR